jgi:phytoene dehydrogenase-like protein
MQSSSMTLTKIMISAIFITQHSFFVTSGMLSSSVESRRDIMSSFDVDAVVIGSGPNGLAAAITLARAGCSVLVIEAKSTPGGGMRSLELTLPGFIHDMCSAAHPLAVASPFFQSLPLTDHGLEWVYPTSPAAHPLDNQPAIIIEQSLDAAAAQMGIDARRYRLLLTDLVAHYRAILGDFLGPLRLPRAPIWAGLFGARAIFPAAGLARLAFQGERARAAFAGMAAHSTLPMEWSPTAAIGLVLMLLAHAVNWPLARGGSQKLADAMVSYLQMLSGQVITNRPIQQWADLPRARTYLFDVSPNQFLKIAGERLPTHYRDQLARFRYGPGVFKLDYALSDPVPWRDSAVARAGTVHLGGTLDEIALSERLIWKGQHAERPYVLLIQPTLFDPTRAPEGKHVLWAYCHVPHGSTVDMTAQIEAQIERFAPGFRETILARSFRNSAEMEAYNANYVGGDINSGAQTWRQLFTRPSLSLTPYATPLEGVFLCSSSTPPGGGVHGMAGFHAASLAIRRL